MPIPEFTKGFAPRRGRSGRDIIDGIVRRHGGPKRPERKGGVPEPLEPDKPKPLSGGAAAELEFDD